MVEKPPPLKRRPRGRPPHSGSRARLPPAAGHLEETLRPAASGTAARVRREAPALGRPHHRPASARRCGGEQSPPSAGSMRCSAAARQRPSAPRLAQFPRSPCMAAARARLRSGAALGVLAYRLRAPRVCSGQHARAHGHPRPIVDRCALAVRRKSPRPAPASTSRRAVRGGSFAHRTRSLTRTVSCAARVAAGGQALSASHARRPAPLRVAMRCSAGCRGFARFASRSLPRVLRRQPASCSRRAASAGGAV